MRRLGIRFRPSCLMAVAAASMALLPCSGWSQTQSRPAPISITELNSIRQYLLWPISGRVTTLKGDPLKGVKVRVEVGAGMESLRIVETNLQGEFAAEFKVEARVKNLRVDVLAAKPGFLNAHETEEFKSEEAIRGFNLVLRDEAVNPEMLTLAALVAALAPRFSARGAGLVPADARREYERGGKSVV